MGTWACGHVGTGPTPRALVCTVGKSKSFPIMPFNSVKRKESKPGKQETQALVPAPHSLVTRHKPWKLQFPDALNGDKKASQGFLLDEGGIKEVLTHVNLFLETEY